MRLPAGITIDTNSGLFCIEWKGASCYATTLAIAIRVLRDMKGAT